MAASATPGAFGDDAILSRGKNPDEGAMRMRFHSPRGRAAGPAVLVILATAVLGFTSATAVAQARETAPHESGDLAAVRQMNVGSPAQLTPANPNSPPTSTTLPISTIAASPGVTSTTPPVA